MNEQVTLLYLDSRLDTVNERLRGMDRALNLQAAEMERRLKGLNELREEFSRRSGSFVDNADFDKLESGLSNGKGA